MTVVSIRGTHGSGKSTICRKIIDLYGGRALSVDRMSRGKAVPYVLGYFVTLPGVRESLFIVGRYDIACGGCDAIQPYSDIWPLARKMVDAGHHVLFEGALVSSSYGSIGYAMDELAARSRHPVLGYFAFLDTPVEVCLARIKERRAVKGNFEPVDPKNTVVKHDNVHRTKDQMRRLGSKVRIVDIDHTRAVKDVLKLFGVTLRKELA